MNVATMGVTITQTFIRNYGDETNRTSTVSLTPVGSETRVLRKFEAAALDEMIRAGATTATLRTIEADLGA